MAEQPAHPGPVDPVRARSAPEPAGGDTRSAPFTGLLKDVLVIVGGMAVLGLLCGFVWSRVVEPAELIRFETRVDQDELQLARVFDADAWFAVIAAVGAGLSGLVFGLWRKRDELRTLVLVLVGCVVAALVMWVAGVALGPPDPSAALENAAVGTRADAPIGRLDLTDPRPAWPIFLAWPVSALAGLLVALLGRTD